jgi:thioredoxin reductase
MTENYYDVVIIGGGAAGLSAGAKTAEAGLKTAIMEREPALGGILLQCIHNGFGLQHFKEELTGPEYAERVKDAAISAGCNIFTETTVMDIHVQADTRKTIRCSSRIHGILEFEAGAVILAMGCRERNRGNLGIPGERPAGIYTAGFAQHMLNINGCIPGKKAVIIGSGDIGLIMARRLTWSGVDVQAVVEIMPHPSGLPRNIAQCLDDFDIPLYLNHMTTQINGKNRVESIEIAPLEHGMPNHNAAMKITCDTILLSVGLIPENELSVRAGTVLNPDTGGPLVDSALMTNINGVFACGNVLHVHDLVDFASLEAIDAARAVIEYLRNKPGIHKDVKVIPGTNVKYTVPNGYGILRHNSFYLRSMAIMDNAKLSINQGDQVIYAKKLRHVKPAEMLKVKIPESCEINTSIPLMISLEAL